MRVASLQNKTTKFAWERTKIMNRRIWMFLSLAALFLLTGCWDRAELPEKGFVMGVAIDKQRSGKISLTTQIFKPSQGVSAIGGKAAKCSLPQCYDSERIDIPEPFEIFRINLGRKAQWSHTRLIIIGEKLARKQEINEILEFFYRDHEPRLTIAHHDREGKSGPVFNIEADHRKYDKPAIISKRKSVMSPAAAKTIVYQSVEAWVCR